MSTRDEMTAARDAKVLDALTRAANERRVCPTNMDLCLIIGAESVSVSVNAMHRLEKRRLIRVDRYGSSRIVTILATGAATAGEPGRPHWRHRHVPMPVKRQAKTERPAAPAIPKRDPVRVDREPCFYCNTRADIGCRHNRAARLAEQASSDQFHTHAAAR